ncbi:MAG: type II toxin-antitoxin system prevent-host-death family antitoxin [Alphaproteobacteria bacterium]|nr:type II toxin-antitoxin system prevent-host-death family antitoxin [Alphaproteobacteria bacterium]
MKTVSIREANRDLSKLIQELEREGEEFVITRRGRPVARLTPHREDRTADPEWQAAYARMKKQLKEGLHLGGEKFDRESLYDRWK